MAPRSKSPPNLDGSRLIEVHDRLLDHFGPQEWWPGDTPFEVMVGAVLTQNTAWTNVERAIDRLRDADCLDAQSILDCDETTLPDLIRPSGYFNIKADRLRHLCRWYLNHGGHKQLKQWETDDLRRDLLAVKGIGPETCDDILLYAFHRPVFVVDAYTVRIFTRLGLIDDDPGYEALRAAIEKALPSDTALFNEYHALIVQLGKDICRPRPVFSACPLGTICPYAERIE